MSLNEEISELRKKLDDSISKNESYDKIYSISLQLDELIAKYYKNKMERYT